LAIAIEVRTNRRRLMLNWRRYRSTSRSCRCMIRSCSWLGGGGMYSPLEDGSTSTGSPSHWSGHDLLHLIISDESPVFVDYRLTICPAGSRVGTTERP